MIYKVHRRFKRNSTAHIRILMLSSLNTHERPPQSRLLTTESTIDWNISSLEIPLGLKRRRLFEPFRQLHNARTHPVHVQMSIPILQLPHQQTKHRR